MEFQNNVQPFINMITHSGKGAMVQGHTEPLHQACDYYQMPDEGVQRSPDTFYLYCCEITNISLRNYHNHTRKQVSTCK